MKTTGLLTQSIVPAMDKEGTKSVDVLVIGAGLTGLTTAFLLKRKGKRVLVVEKTERPGGAIKTFHEGGYTFDTGPNTGVLSNVEVITLFDLLKDDCTLQIANKSANKRLIWKKNRLYALPCDLLTGVTTPLFSWGDKLNLLVEPFRKKGSNPNESVADLSKRRLGKSIFNYAVEPFIGGIYAGDPNLLTTRFALPKLYRLEQEYGSFIRGAIKKRKEPKTAQEQQVSKEVFSVKGGMENLISALVKAIGEENIVYGQIGVTVAPHEKGWAVQLVDGMVVTPRIVSTIGTYALPSLLPFASKQQMAAINNLRYAKVVQVSIGVQSHKDLDLQAFGALIPSIEQRSALGILYPSSCFGQRAPENGNVLSVFLGGMNHPEIIHLPDEAIERIVLDELKVIYQIPDLKIDYMHISRHLNAIPQYEANSQERLDAIKAFEREHPGIILAGNIRDGIGMADRIKQAFVISEQLIMNS